MRLSHIVSIVVLLFCLVNGHLLQNRFFDNVRRFLEQTSSGNSAADENNANRQAYDDQVCVLQFLDILKAFAEFDKWAMECKLPCIYFT